MSSKIDKKHIRPVLLAGGSGNRLWPFSTSERPKQFLKLFDESYSLFQNTIRRLKSNDRIIFLDPLILTAEPYQLLVENQLKEIGVEPFAILLEPTPKNTAPSILSALIYLEKEECNGILQNKWWKKS